MRAFDFKNEHFYNGPPDDDRIDVVVRVFSPNAPPVSVNALLDTGAENCIFSKAYVPLLGILDVTSGRPQPVQTADNRIDTAYLHDFEIEFVGQRLTVPIGFVPAWPEDIDNLLGMKGFFSQITFGLDHEKRTLYFNA